MSLKNVAKIQGDSFVGHHKKIGNHFRLKSEGQEEGRELRDSEHQRLKVAKKLPEGKINAHHY